MHQEISKYSEKVHTIKKKKWKIKKQKHANILNFLMMQRNKRDFFSRRHTFYARSDEKFNFQSSFSKYTANTHWTYRFFSFSTLNVLECTVWVNLASACIFPNNKPVKNVYFVAFSSIYVVQLYTLALFLEAFESYANVNIFYFYLGAVAAAVPVVVVVVSTADIVTVWFFSLL